jgi:hypothetical protein
VERHQTCCALCHRFLRDLLRLRPALCAIAAAGLAALLLLPILPAQAQLTSGYTRSDATIRRNSAQPVDFLRLGSRSWGRATLPWLRERGGSSTPCCAIIFPASSNYAARFVLPFSPRSSSSAWPATGLRCCEPAGDERRRAEARDQGSGGRDQGAEDK